MTEFNQQNASDLNQDHVDEAQAEGSDRIENATESVQDRSEDVTTDLPNIGSDESNEGVQEAGEGRSEDNDRRPFGSESVESAPQETKDEADRIVNGDTGEGESKFK